MLPPQKKNQLLRLTMAAQSIIYNAGRFAKLLKMMNTKIGAIQAVKTIIGAIELKQKIPPDLALLLGINIYTELVAMAQDTTGLKADTKIVQGVMTAIVHDTLQSHGPSAQQQPAQQPQAQPQAQPQPTPQARQPGLINQGV